MRKFLVGLLCVCLAIAASGQSISAYLKLRKQFGIKAPVGPEVLSVLVGTKVVELKGLVKGSFQVGDKTTLMIERTDGGTEMVETGTLPDWLTGTDVAARLLVKATREDETASLKANLLGAAPEGEVRPYDVVPAAKPSSKAPAAGGRSVQNPLSGPIGRGSSRGTGRTRNDLSLPASEVAPIYAAFIKKVNPRLANSEALKIAQAVVGYSLKFGVDARLIMAIVMTESDFKPGTVSHAGAMGLGQLMPVNMQELGLTNAFDTFQNLYGTVKLVRGHLMDYAHQDDFNRLVLALAAYNAGPGAVRKYGGVPPYRETQNYVRKVIALYNQFCGRA